MNHAFGLSFRIYLYAIPMPMPWGACYPIGAFRCDLSVLARLEIVDKLNARKHAWAM